MGARCAINFLRYFVSLVQLPFELVISVFPGRNYTPVFSPKISFPCLPACYLDLGTWLHRGLHRCGKAQYNYSPAPVSLQANLICIVEICQISFVAGTFSFCFILGRLGSQCFFVSRKLSTEWQQVFLASLHNNKTGDGGVDRRGFFGLSFDHFPRCTLTGKLSLDWQLNEGFLSALRLLHNIICASRAKNSTLLIQILSCLTWTWHLIMLSSCSCILFTNYKVMTLMIHNLPLDIQP